MTVFVHPRPGLTAGAAGDESWSWTDVATLKSAQVTDLFVYCGPAMPPATYTDAVRAAGISITFIDEGAVAPYAVVDPLAAGVARARAAEAKLAGLYPDDCSIVYVLSDQNVTTPGPGDPRVSAHAQGIDTATSRPGWVAYSNRNGINSARAVAPKLHASWVPRTWGANDDDALVQEIGSPIDGLDLDTIQQPEWGQWHPDSTPSPEEDDMKYPLAIVRVIEDSRVFAVGLTRTYLPSVDTIQLYVDLELVEPGDGPGGAKITDRPKVYVEQVPETGATPAPAGATLTQADVEAAVRDVLHGA